MKARVVPGVAVALLLAAGCAAGPRDSSSATSPPPAPSPAPTRDPAKDALPLVADVRLGASDHTFQGGDDHVTLSIDNRGRDIQDLVVRSPRWVAEHGLSMGSTRSCDPDPDAGLIACGPLYAGQSMPVILRAIPAHVGTFHYEMSLFDRENGTLVPVGGLDGRPVAFDFTEVVDPLTSQVPGGQFTPPASPSASPS